MATALFQKRAVTMATQRGSAKTETLLWSCCSGWRRSCQMSHLVAPAVSPLSSAFSEGSSSLNPPKLQQESPRLFSFGGLMELMAVPKKKVSRYKRGLRNGPKALKPVPVIVRCRSCGRVKLPHFYCCSGEIGSSERNDSTS